VNIINQRKKKKSVINTGIIINKKIFIRQLNHNHIIIIKQFVTRTQSMDKTLNRRHRQSLGPNSILKSIIKIEVFQLTDKRTIKCTCTNVCRKRVPYIRRGNAETTCTKIKFMRQHR